MSEERHIALYYKEGKSDKEYHIHLVPKEKLYVVLFEYGRRGSSLTSSSKTPVPVDLDKAIHVFDAEVHKRKLKGYCEAAGQAPYVGSDKEQKITGVLPQLLNRIGEEDLDEYFDSPNYCLQEKKDGKRILLRKSKNGSVEGINRKGLLVGIPAIIAETLEKIKSSFIFDGELIGETIWLFDSLEFSDNDLRGLRYEQRLGVLQAALPSSRTEGSYIRVVETTTVPQEKRERFQILKAQGVEGVVFKKIDSKYNPGRPASGGDQLKFKFTNTCTCIVSAHNEKGKRSVYIQAREDKNTVDVGKVTILPNFPIPKIGTLVEIRYLYRHVHGALYQPIYLGERDDLSEADDVKTLKVKEGLEDEEEN